MKFLLSVVLSFLIATAVLCQTDTTTTQSSSSVETTTTPSDTTTTSPEPPTTQPITTSTEPTTSSSTQSTSTSSTTERPTSTSTALPVTTAAPEPPKEIPKGDWNVTQDNVTCIRVEMKMYFEIAIENKTEYIVVYPNASSADSNCNLSNNSQSFVLSESNAYTFTMVFVNDGGKTFVNETTLVYALPDGRGSASTYLKLFGVKSGNSYLCNTESHVKFENVTVIFTDVQLQAFGKKGNDKFSSAEECANDDKVGDAIPIAVGCALAALIIIVLIAYLVGRRQSRQRGYQSV